jgi:cysteine dioxygenase
VSDQLVFSDVAYQRVLIHSAPGYEVLILCWRSGQRSPIHDHAGSACGVCIVDGVATETLFLRSPCGRLVPTRSRTAGSGTLWISRDADVHQMANLEPRGRDLVSLHIYSPPLAANRTFSIDDTTLAGLDVLAASRPPTVTSKLLRLDEPHPPSRNRLTRAKQVTS